MKALPQLLSSLLVASVALMNSGAVLSGTQAKKGQVKSSLKSTVKRAPLADGSAKRVLNVAVQVATAAVTGVGVNESTQAATTAPLAPPATVVAARVDAGIVAAPLALAPSLSLASSVPVVAAKETPPTSPVAPVVVKETPPASPVAPSVAKAAPVPVAAPTPAVSEAWKQIAKGPALVTVTATTVVTAAAPSSNPYLAYRTATYNQAAPTVPPVAAVAPATPATSVAPVVQSGEQIINTLRAFLPEPHLPSPDIDILPSVTKVYPTGERPMYVLTFKCPTELVGITPPPTKALRWLISSGMDAVNSTNLLSFSMQQVCQ
ncbi:MAG: hypothetical protein Q8M09_03720 [Pseudomonadota bacterium]|nr:hypothetical protein [Pseudomonadota bacterium]MDP1903345.1 hypothetical protein [Pseudomonadota bacterium]MDP2354235.1 hypothetical protein [Pseudomonadota bacterium]